MRQLFHSPQVAATWDLPCHLQSLSQMLGISVELLIDKHTLFPYYASALPAFRAHLLRKWMESDGMAGRIHMAIGASASAVPVTRYLRYCPDCAKADADDWGSPTWRRVHQCPGVVWCPIHRRPLWLSSISLAAGRSHKHAAVDLRRVLADAPGEPLLVREITMAERIALRSRELIDGKGPLGPFAWQNAHREQCDRAGWTTKTGRIRVRSLRGAVDSRNQEFWRELGVRADFQSETHWMPALLRKPRKAAHPLLHLLMEAFLLDAPSAPRPKRSARRSMPAAGLVSQIDCERANGDRSKWMELTEHLPNAGVNRCRKMEPALYARLYRSSLPWLQQWNEEHLPHQRSGGKPRVDWAIEDERLLALFGTVRNRLLEAPRRVTRSALLRELSRKCLRPSRLAKLPQLREALKRQSETPDQFLRRRLCRAYERWVAEHDRLPRDWELLRAANVRWPWSARAFCAAHEISVQDAGESAVPVSKRDRE